MSEAKSEPVFVNATRNRIMVANSKRATFWLDPGKTVKGESYRVYTKIGLREVKNQPFPVSSSKPQAPVTPLVDSLLAKSKAEVAVPALKTSQEKRDGAPEVSKAIQDDEVSVQVVSDPTNYPFACDAEGCLDRFASEKGLRLHKRRHTTASI